MTVCVSQRDVDGDWFSEVGGSDTIGKPFMA